MNEIKLNVAIQQFLVRRLCAILSMTEILDILSTKRQLIFAGLSLSLSSWYSLLEYSHVHSRVPVFSRGCLLPCIGSNDVQWCQIWFSGTEPCVVGFSWRSFPVWRRLPVVLCVNFIILNLSYHYFKEFYYVNYKGYKTFCTFCLASKKVHRKLWLKRTTSETILQ